MNQFWLWNTSAAVYNHAHVWFQPELPWNCLFLAKFGGRLGMKWCVWMEKPCTIPIPGFINLAHKPILSVECFCSNLQPFAHVIWAKSALELIVFGQSWAHLGSKCCGWLKMPCVIPTPVVMILACEPILTLELLQISGTTCTYNLGQSSPGIGHFWPNLGVSLAVNGVFRWK